MFLLYRYQQNDHLGDGEGKYRACGHPGAVLASDVLSFLPVDVFSLTLVDPIPHNPGHPDGVVSLMQPAYE